MQINKMEISDIDEIIKYEEQYLGTTLGKDYFLQTIKDEYSYFLVAKENDKIVGYISSTLDTYAEILNFFVVSEFRGKGIGNKLLNCVIQKAQDSKCKSIYLEVNEINENAIALYLKNGFIKDHIRKNYYKDHDAYAMIKEL